MPKLRRRLRVGGVNLTLPSNISCNTTTAANNNINKLSTDTSGVSQASSSQSVQQDDRPIIGEFPFYVCFANDNDDVGRVFIIFCCFADGSFQLLTTREIELLRKKREKQNHFSNECSPALNDAPTHSNVWTEKNSKTHNH